MSLAKKARSKALKVIEGGVASGESKYRAIFEQSSDAVVTFEMDHRIDDVNVAFSEMSGYLRSELEHSQLDLLVPNETTRLPERTRPFSKKMMERSGTYEDVAIRRKDGYARVVDLFVRKVMREDKDFYLALFRDVTEKKLMERELITKHSALKMAYAQLEQTNAELKSTQETLVQAGKMAALGELAAGIAHELNQPLMGIRGYAQELVETENSLQDQSKKFLGEIVKNADKMSKIIHYLRTFTSKSVDGFEATNLHYVIEESLKMVDHQFKARGIKVVKDFSSDLPNVYANPVQLEQVFINLATNARDAIDEAKKGSGTVRIRTKKSGSFVEIHYHDDGCGMTDVAKKRFMNPFFTTKEVGKGMGLGMSLSYGILNKIHASMVVKSKLGEGSEFQIRIPIDFRELA